MIEFGTLILQKNAQLYSYCPIDNIVHVNTQSKNIIYPAQRYSRPPHNQQSTAQSESSLPFFPRSPPSLHHPHPLTDKNFSENTSHSTFWNTEIQVSISYPKNIYYLLNISQIMI